MIHDAEGRDDERLHVVLIADLPGSSVELLDVLKWAKTSMVVMRERTKREREREREREEWE